MSPMFLASLSVLMAFAAAAFSAGQSARAWRLAAALGVALIGAAVALQAPGGLGHDLYLQAQDAAGQPVYIDVQLQRAGGARQLRQLTLEQPLTGSGWMLLLMVAVSLVGAALSQVLKVTSRLPALGAILPVAGAALALAVLAGAGPEGQDAEAIRQFLLAQGAEDVALTAFTVPEVGWQFHQPASTAVGYALLLSLVGAFSAIRPAPLRSLGPIGLALGTLGLVGALIWRLAQVDGLVWRGPEFALMMGIALLASAWATIEGHVRGQHASAVLTAGAVAVIIFGGIL